MRVSRGRYVSAGYAEKRARPAADERELYISADPAGSAGTAADYGFGAAPDKMEPPYAAVEKTSPVSGAEVSAAPVEAADPYAALAADTAGEPAEGKEEA